MREIDREGGKTDRERQGKNFQGIIFRCLNKKTLKENDGSDLACHSFLHFHGNPITIHGELLSNKYNRFILSCIDMYPMFLICNCILQFLVLFFISEYHNLYFLCLHYHCNFNHLQVVMICLVKIIVLILFRDTTFY